MEKIKIRQNLIFETFGKDSYIYSPEKDEVFSLNSTGTFIFQLIFSKGIESEEGILTCLKQEFLDMDDAQKDLCYFLRVLKDAGILQ